ncbi:MAG: coproporphyrinogen dehydrogenase HemZ [Ruminococcaceae bacterium]|nr:coproporphyrinogen dehydrogenase HemZ [Oscillospiraceae bacterium]
MKIELISDDGAFAVNYIQSLVLLFMPCEKFGESDNDSHLVFVVKREGDSFFGRAVFDIDGNVYEKSMSAPISFYEASNNSAKCFAGKLFLALFSEVFGYKPPWGILTGVRPARFALDYLLSGVSVQKTKQIFVEMYHVDPEKADLAIRVALCEMTVLQEEKERQFSLYIGIPFCPSRCRYCSFVSYATPKLLSLLPEYLEMLAYEVQMLCDVAREAGLDLKSVYVGGGTPSVLTCEQMADFVPKIRSFIGNKQMEFTYEAGRPDTVTKEKLSVLSDCGVTRLSINTQTTNDAVLQSVGRCHTFEDYKNAFCLAKDMGFAINTDLIAGLPGESIESFCKSIDDVLSLSPDNITVHSFSLKKSSEYTVGGKTFDRNDHSIDKMLSYSSARMKDHRYFPYYMYRQKNTDGNFENVGYTNSENAIARYNIYMMEGFHSVLAAGAGAATKLVSRDLATTGKIYNPKYPYEYLRAKDDILKNREQILLFYKEKYNN